MRVEEKSHYQGSWTSLFLVDRTELGHTPHMGSRE